MTAPLADLSRGLSALGRSSPHPRRKCSRKPSPSRPPALHPLPAASLPLCLSCWLPSYPLRTIMLTKGAWGCSVLCHLLSLLSSISRFFRCKLTLRGVSDPITQLVRLSAWPGWPRACRTRTPRGTDMEGGRGTDKQRRGVASSRALSGSSPGQGWGWRRAGGGGGGQGWE